MLVTNNRKSMPGQLTDHLADGRHIEGIFVIDPTARMGLVIEDLILIAGASFEGEYRDRITYLPLT